MTDTHHIQTVLEEMASEGQSLSDISRKLGIVMAKVLLADATKWNMTPTGIAYFSQTSPCASAFKSGMESIILLEVIKKLDDEIPIEKPLTGPDDIVMISL